MRDVPVRILRSAATRGSDLAGQLFHTGARAAGSVFPLADTAARNAADAAAHATRAARHRDRVYREADEIIARRP